MGAYISRQRDFADNCLYVELSFGGKSKAGKDILTPRYASEGKILVSPIDAVNAAERIYKQWDKDYADEKKQLRIVGLPTTLVFEFDAKGIAAAKAFANKMFEEMKKCGNITCAKLIGNRAPYEHDDLIGVVCCSELCLCRKYKDMFGIELPRVTSSKLRKIFKV